MWVLWYEKCQHFSRDVSVIWHAIWVIWSDIWVIWFQWCQCMHAAQTEMFRLATSSHHSSDRGDDVEAPSGQGPRGGHLWKNTHKNRLCISERTHMRTDYVSVKEHTQEQTMYLWKNTHKNRLCICERTHTRTDYVSPVSYTHLTLPTNHRV